MGGKYSKKVYENKAEEPELFRFDIIKARSKALLLERETGKKGIYFLTKEDLKFLFGFNDVQLFKCFQIFDKNKTHKISSLDFWGALVLAGPDLINNKIKFLFDFVSHKGNSYSTSNGNSAGNSAGNSHGNSAGNSNQDNTHSNGTYLSYDEVMVLSLSVTRGLAYLKGYEQIPTITIEKTVIESFRSTLSPPLNEKGEISLEKFSKFLLSKDKCKAYFANLKGLKVEEISTVSLISRRSTAVQELITIKSSINTVLLELEALENDKNSYLVERGGDLLLAKLSTDEMSTGSVGNIDSVRPNYYVHSTIADEVSIIMSGPMGSNKRNNNILNNSNSAISNSADSNGNSHSDLLPSEVAARKYFSKKGEFADVQVYSDARGGKPATTTRNIFSDNFRDELYKLWLLIPADNKSYTTIDRSNSDITRVNEATGNSASSTINLQSNADTELFPAVVEHLIRLDEFIVISLFDEVDALITHQLARQLIAEVPTDKYHRYSFRDVLKWYRINVIAEELLAKNADLLEFPNWTKAKDRIYATNTRLRKYYSHLKDLLVNQRQLLTSIEAIPSEIMCKYPPFNAGMNSSNAYSNHPASVSSRHSFSRSSNHSINSGFTSNNPSRNSSANSSRATTPVSRTTTTVSKRRTDYLTKFQQFKKTISHRKRPAQIVMKYSFGDYELYKSNSEYVNHNINNGINAVASILQHANSKKLASQKSFRSSISRPADDSNIDYQLMFRFNLTTNQSLDHVNNVSNTNTRVILDLENKNNCIIEDFNNIDAVDVLYLCNNIYNPILMQDDRSSGGNDNDQGDSAIESNNNNDSANNDANSNVNSEPFGNLQKFSNVIWISFEMKPEISFEQEVLLEVCIYNFFKYLPLDFRDDIYTDVHTQTCSIKRSKANDSTDKPKPSAKPSTTKSGKGVRASMDLAQLMATLAEQVNETSTKVVLVSLLSNNDSFKELEKLLVLSDVFISRSISNLSFEVLLVQSLSELVSTSKRYNNYCEKLYGPQEEELGEEGMNPLNFAKNIRNSKKAINEIIASLPNLRREQLEVYCKEHGINAFGSQNEIRKRLESYYKKYLELLGHGDLSTFSKNMIHAMFHKYKSNSLEDSDDFTDGLLFWDLNRLLYTANAATIYDKAEYKRIMEESDLLLDKNGLLVNKGLEYYYLKNGRLANDNSKIGIGSVANELVGKLIINTNFESDAIATILSLVGRSNIYVPQVIKNVLLLSAVKDIKFEGQISTIAELFKPFESHANANTTSYFSGFFTNSNSVDKASANSGKNDPSSTNDKKRNSDSDSPSPINDVLQFFEKLKSLLTIPGQLASSINKISELLADGTDGLIPSIRQYVFKIFGKYDDWEQIFSETIISKIRFELDSLELSSSGNQVKSESMAIHSPIHSRNGEADGVVNLASPKSSRQEAVEEESELEKQLRLEEERRLEGKRRMVIKRMILSLFPVMPKISNLAKELLACKEELIAINESTSMLSLHESKLQTARKEHLQKRIEAINKERKERDQIYAVYICAFYDAIRLLCYGINNIGFGSPDITFRGDLFGFNFAQYLPKGLGELAPEKQAIAEKIERAKRRKNAALAALERERIRRNLTDEEKEVLRLQKLELQYKEWADEENELIEQAMTLLFEAREENKSSAELLELTKAWETVISIREERYPYNIRTYMLSNNVGSILLEMYGLDHPFGNNAIFHYQAAAESVMKEYNKDLVHALLVKRLEDNDESQLEYDPEIHGQLRTDYPPALETENFETTVGPKLVILLNYLAILMKTESVSLLRNSYPIKEYAFYLKLFLSAKDLEKINNGVTNSIYKVPILSYGKHKSTVEYVNKEVIYVLQQDAKPVIREEEQSLGTIDEQSESHKDEQSLQLSKASDRTAQRKREREMKKAKSEQQRKALSAKRAEVSYQRKFLYQLIQSDEISDIFNAKAGHVNETVNPNWESSKEDRLIGSAKEYEKILASMSQTMDKAEDDD